MVLVYTSIARRTTALENAVGTVVSPIESAGSSVTTGIGDWFMGLFGRSAIQMLADEQHREAELTLYGAPILRISPEDVLKPQQFVDKLTRYGIPRSERVATEIKRLVSVSPQSKLTYTEVAVSQETIEGFLRAQQLWNGTQLEERA